MKQACGFRDAFSAFKDRDIVVFGVSYDSPNALKTFSEKHHIPFTFLSDAEKIAGKAYGVNRYFFTSRKTFLIEKDGTIGKIFNKVDLDTHPDDVLKFFNYSNTQNN
ncbi:MAG: peroxiredoxin [Candidatus Marinimicrobia bacterium]|nr:peroxiredoxin [Candidatus Neomarinimicrobiota bacterium]